MKEIIQQILDNPYWSAILIFVSQVAFIYFRTLNVIYTSERKTTPAMITANALSISWLVSTAIGTNSIIEGRPIPIILFLIGGSIGTYWGIRQNSKK